MTLEKLAYIESQCINPQDAVIIRLLMEGVGIHEIVYLKKDSLDERNQILTFKDATGNQRQCKVTSRCAELFISAINQKKYVLNNGSSLSRQLYMNLRDSDNLIKVCFQDFIANRSLIIDTDSVLLRTIYMRVRRLSENFSTPELTPLTAASTEQQEMTFA